MQIIKKIAAFIIAVIIVELFFSFLLEPVTFEHFLNFDERRMKKSEQETQLAFFGDSRSIRSYNPSVFEQEMKESISTVMNEGVNQQHLISTYYYMKDYLKRSHLKMAVVNLNYDYFMTTTTEPVEAKGLTFDRIKSIDGMAEFVWKRFSLKEYPNVIKSFRYRWQVKNIPINVKSKFTKAYWSGIDERNDIHYVKNGFVTWDLSYKQGNTGTPAGCIAWDSAQINEEAFDILEKIALLGEKYDVQIVFVESPVTIGRLYAIDGYSEFESILQKRCEKIGVPFYNLNLLKENSVSFDDELFSDTEHLNAQGADKISHLLADILKAGEGAENYFYPSFDALNEQKPQIGACDIEITQKGDGIMLQAVSFADERLEVLYQFLVSCDGGESYQVLQEYSKKDTFFMSTDGVLKDTIFMVETKPQEMMDYHHCYMARSVSE